MVEEKRPSLVAVDRVTIRVAGSRSAGASGLDGSRSAVLLLLLVGIGMIVNAGGVESTSKCCDGAPHKLTDRGRFST
jgi:hypothetical protein